MPSITKHTLAPSGSTGNNTHSSVALSAQTKSITALCRITNAGATPTVTFALQGSIDDPSVADGASNWFSLSVRKIDNTSKVTLVLSDTQTAVGGYAYAVPEDVAVRKVRLAVSANTNITYTAELAEFSG